MLVGIVICICNIIIMMTVMPRKRLGWNEVSVAGQGPQMVRMYLGLLYMTGADSWYMNHLATDVLMIILIFVPSIVFMSFLFFQIRTQTLLLLLKHNYPRLFKIGTFGLTSPDAFLAKHGPSSKPGADSQDAALAQPTPRASGREGEQKAGGGVSLEASIATRLSLHGLLEQQIGLCRQIAESRSRLQTAAANSSKYYPELAELLRMALVES